MALAWPGLLVAETLQRDRLLFLLPPQNQFTGATAGLCFSACLGAWTLFLLLWLR